MKVVDANVLIYAVNADAAHHEDSRIWLDRALNGGSSIGLSWLALLAFVRIVSHPRVFEQPLRAQAAMERVDDWLTRPAAHLLNPGAGHAAVLGRILREGGSSAAGNLVNDAHLAALAIEHRGTLVSYDRDFARFPEVRVASPTDLLT